MLVLTLACGAGSPTDESRGRQDPIPTPDRAQVQIIDDETPAGLTDADAINAYQQGYAHIRAAAWFSAIAAYDEAIASNPPSPASTKPAAQPTCTPAGMTKDWRITAVPSN